MTSSIASLNPPEPNIWHIHQGLRTNSTGIVALPRLSSTEAYLKWTKLTDPTVLADESYIYIDYIKVAAGQRKAGLGTKLLHALCTANDNHAQPRFIALVASPSADCELGIDELERWYSRRGFYSHIFPDSELLVRQPGDKSIYRAYNKYFKVTTA